MSFAEAFSEWWHKPACPVDVNTKSNAVIEWFIMSNDIYSVHNSCDLMSFVAKSLNWDCGNLMAFLLIRQQLGEFKRELKA